MIGLFSFTILSLPTHIASVAKFILFRPLIVLIYTSTTHNRATNATTSAYRSRYSTTETWASAAAEHGSVQHAASICAELRGARYLLIPEVVLGAAMLVMVMWMRLRGVKKRRGVDAEQEVEVGVKV